MYILPIIFSTAIAGVSYAQTTWIDLVRVEDGEFSRDIVYQGHNGQWQEPVYLTNGSRTEEFTPVSLRISERRALVIWKEMIGVDASNLLFGFIDFDSSNNVTSVSTPQTLNTISAHQSSPTMIIDKKGRIWGFWVGFNGREDDIYYAEFKLDNWSEEKRLFDSENGVPDLHPTARLNFNDEVELRWRQFSFQQNAYIDVFSKRVESDDTESTSWTLPQEYIVNPLEKVPRLPRDFSFPSGVSMPGSVAINTSEAPNFALHWDKLPDANNAASPSANGLD